MGARVPPESVVGAAVAVAAVHLLECFSLVLAMLVFDVAAVPDPFKVQHDSGEGRGDEDERGGEAPRGGFASAAAT
jgi:hypothetical protein